MRCAILACAFLLSAPFGWAQQDMGVITGVITDATGGSVPGAKITVVNRQTNESRSVESSEAGSYTVGPLRIGSYDITVEMPGFKKAVWQGIVLHAQDRVRADFRLDVGEVAETATVTAEAPLLQSETSTLSHVVGQKEINDLPLNGRNFQQLAWQTAGVMPATRSRDRESGFNSHGQPMTQNSFIIDGIDNNNNVMGMQDRKMQVVVPSLDAVAEFTVQTSNYSPEFGRNSGAVMIVSVKTGTNRFSGTAYEFIRNDIFDARDTFNYVDRNGDGKADPEVLRQNQFGATFGGPIRRDKTFFFVSWESRRERREQSDRAVVPTAAERNGEFDPRVRVITDPLTGKPFPGNKIQRDRFDPTAAKLLELWPLPNFSGSGTRANFIRNPPWSTDRDQIDTRIDHNLSESDKLFARFSISPFKNLRASVFDLPARGGQDNDRAVDDNDAASVALSYTRIFTPTLVNEFRFGFIRQKVDKRELSAEPLSELTTRYGIKGIPGGERLFGLPQFQFTGAISYQGLGEPGSMPNFKVHEVRQYLDNISWNRGLHNFKFGIDFRWNRSDIFGGNSSHGNFTFDGQFTGVSFADFLLGWPASAALSSTLTGNMRFRNYMFYALDDWKVTPRLTLNLGLRYELTSPWFEESDRMNALVISPGPDFNTIRPAGYCGGSWSCRALVNTDVDNWAPRIGFAYQLTPRTVVRSGYGVFYGGQGSLGADARMINNFPFNRSVTLQSATSRPAVQLAGGLPPDALGSETNPPDNLNWNVWESDFPEPTIHQWNLAVQREIVTGFSLTAAYVGSASSHLMDAYNWNGSPPGPPATERQRRRIPQWNTISLRAPFGHSVYHGLDLQLERRFAQGFSLSAAYTWSHSIDNVSEQFGSGGGGRQDFRNIDASRGNSEFDYRHRFVSAALYELPVGNSRRWLSRSGALNQFFGGWELSGLVSAQTGHYFTLTVPNARQRLGATGVGQWFPDRVASGKLSRRTADQWFDTSAFVVPRNADGNFRLGNAGRGILNGDGPFDIDLGLVKSFSIREGVNLQVRWEVFNVTNSPTLSDPVTNIESPDFGKIRNTVSTPRQMQFALRLAF
ncbi:MAG TPA: TonB-dependent receptor [Acidobacteriota bacterium]|nr:TonB-dependent receptor [Acidobacteriota bacterium]